MKLKKGSKAARDFMAKLRASRGKKKKLSGTKKKTVKKSTAKAKKIHTDVKSHNYRISISGAGDYAKFEISTIKALAKLLKKPLKTIQKAVYDTKSLLDIISNSFDQGKTPLQTAKILKDELVPKKQIKPLDAFVNLLTKKGKGQSSTGSKANFPFPIKLPATVTIGGITEKSLIDEIKITRRNILALENDVKEGKQLLKTKIYRNKNNSYMKANKLDQIKYYKNCILIEKKVLKNLLQIKKVF
jgi:hypothetical protein